MLAQAPLAPMLLLRARADQVTTLYAQWHRTTLSMVLGAALLCTVLWHDAQPAAMLTWFAAILANQAWRGALVHAYRRVHPALDQTARWGLYWSLGSAMAGALWGAAAVLMFPVSTAHQALLIVCLFGVVLGGLNLTAVYKPSFYGFVLTALVPMIARVAWEGDEVHLYTALVMVVVLGFVLTYGHRLNDLLTQSLAMRYENTDLIGELTAQTAAAEKARAAAEDANRAKSQFLAAASHDLRQPLHAMGLFAAALAARAREPSVQPLVRSIHASVEALENLFGQLLDLSRLDAGALRPDIGVVPLDPLFARLHHDFAPQATAAGLSFSLRPTRVMVASDAVLLERILRNLLSNALRYTRAGRVVLGVRRVRGRIRIDVIDTGIGIAAADQRRIFDEFVQIDGPAGRMRRGHGLGLGLAIVRRLAALMSHEIEVISVLGRGSRFALTVARAPAPAARPARDVRVASERSERNSAFVDRRVLVIDDDPGVTTAMQVLFETWGASVIAAGDADEALARICSGGAVDVDLVVADLRLADNASGVDAVGAVRALLGRPVPALIVSGDTTDAARAEVAQAGLALLQKPVVARVLQEAATRTFAADALA